MALCEYWLLWTFVSFVLQVVVICELLYVYMLLDLIFFFFFFVNREQLFLFKKVYFWISNIELSCYVIMLDSHFVDH